MGDKERRKETKQSHLSPASRRGMGDKGDKERQSTVISAKYPDTPWETKGDKAKSQPSIQTHHGRQGETKGDKANHLSQASRHAMGDLGDKGRQSKIIPAQHPDMPWETKGDKAETKQNHLSPASRPWETRGDKGRESSWPGIASRFCARIENPSQESCLGNK